MSLIAKDSGTGGGDYTPVPEGTHQAICNMVVDLGLQEISFQGVPAIKHQCFVRWELPTERIEYTDKKSGEVVTGPMLIGKFYTVRQTGKSAERLEAGAVGLHATELETDRPLAGVPARSASCSQAREKTSRHTGGCRLAEGGQAEGDGDRLRSAPEGTSQPPTAWDHQQADKM